MCVCEFKKLHQSVKAVSLFSFVIILGSFYFEGTMR